MFHREPVEVGRVGDEPGHHQLITRSSPRPSMSMAEREAKWAMRWTRWAGQSRLVQNVSLSPGRRTSGSPQHGQTVGNFHLGLRRFGTPGPAARAPPPRG